MGTFNLWTGAGITIGSLIIFLFFSRKEGIGEKILFGFVILTTYIYSGIGIAYDNVPDKYVVSYFLFVFFLCLTIRVLFHTRFILRRSQTSLDRSTSNGFDIDYNYQIVTLLAIIFIITNGMHLLAPSFNLLKFFSPGLPTSELIYARHAAANSNTILRICSTISIFCLPFFCLYLKKLVDLKKKPLAIFLIILWAYLEYLQYDYLSRYQMLVYFAFAYCIGAFVYPEGIVLKKKYVIIAIVGFVLIVPFLNAYIDLRSGGSLNLEFGSLGKSLQTLAESEIYYPRNFDICSSMYGSESFLNFILWLICLPIPSVLFPGKPTVTLAYSFTYAVSGLQYGNQAYYTSSLPSVVGEGIILLGPWLTGIYGIVLGIFIALYFKFIKKYKSLCILNLYMVLMILTIGRGGASSYMSTLINGTFSMLIWGYAFNKIKYREKVGKRE